MNSLTRDQQIAGIYVGYFDRAPDAAGFIYWTTQYYNAQNAGQALMNIANSFSPQPETLTIYPFLGAPGPLSPSNPADVTGVETLVGNVYSNLFNRTVTQAELSGTTGAGYWVQQILHSQVSIGDAVLAIMNGATGADAETLLNKITVADDFAEQTLAKNIGVTAPVPASVVDEAAIVLTTVTSDPTSVTSAESAISTYVAAWNNDPQIMLTTGADNILVTAPNTTIYGTANGLGATFTPGDMINGNGNANVTLTVSDLSTGATWIPTLLAGVTIAGIQTAVFNSGEAITANTASSAQGWSGLTQLTINDAGATTVTAATTTNVTVVDTGTAGAVTTIGGDNLNITNFGANVTVGGVTGNPAGTVTVTDTAIAANTVATDGGTNVNVTITGATAASPVSGQILIGANLAPTGTVTVAATTGTANGNGIGLITVNGGTTVTVTETAGNSAATGNNTFEGDVLVNGNAATTTVTVNQSPTAVGASAVAAAAGVVGVSAVAASPGVQGVTAVTAMAPVAAQAAVVGTTAGSVIIQDANYNTAAANTITTVTLNNYAASVIKDNALSNLTLQGVAGTLVITNATSGGALPTANSTLTLTLNTLSGANTVVDTNNEIKTLDVVTTSGNSTLAAFIDTGLTKLNVSGSDVVTLPLINSSLTTLTVSGGAGFNDAATTATTGLAALGSALTITDTSGGKFRPR